MAVARMMEFKQPDLPMFSGRPVPLAVPEKPSLRMDEAATLLGVSKEHVRHLIEEGSLTAVDIRCTGTSRPAHRIVQASLVAFIQKRKTI